MRLPNAHQAVVDNRKVRDYLLSDSHPVGRFKAAFFATIGFAPQDWKQLKTVLLTFASENDAEAAEPSPYGRKYLIRGTLTGPAGASADVVTVWIVPTEDSLS